MMEILDNQKYIYFLKNIKNLGDIRIAKIIDVFNTINDFLKSLEVMNYYFDWMNINMLNDIKASADKYDEAGKSFEKLCEICDERNIKIVTLLDENYPENLRNIYDAPTLLYYKGKLDKRDKFSIGIVGTRYPSEYGAKSTDTIVNELSRLSIPIISGMAIGIDGLAHRTALANGNLTYAIIGSGVDMPYPPENRKLYDEIIEKGAVISEFEVGSKAERLNFPKRNRIISGISLGTLIVESAERGGSLITAELALDQNRELFAIPGNIFSKKSEGCNKLIQKGAAKLTASVDDILIELNSSLEGYIGNRVGIKKEKVNAELNIFENSILNILNDVEPVNIDKISELTNFSVSDCLVNLLTMEFKDLVIQLPGKYFIKK